MCFMCMSFSIHHYNPASFYIVGTRAMRKIFTIVFFKQIWRFDILSMSCEIRRGWVQQGHVDDKSTKLHFIIWANVEPDLFHHSYTGTGPQYDQLQCVPRKYAYSWQKKYPNMD